MLEEESPGRQGILPEEGAVQAAPRKRAFAASMALLLAGAVATVAAFIFRTGPERFSDIFPQVSGLLLWLILPYLLLALNTFIIHRFLAKVPVELMLFGGTLTFLVSGVLIYGRAFLAGAAGAMDAHLVFIFGPLYHFIAAALVTVGYLGRGFWLGVNRRGQGPQGGEGSPPSPAR